MPDDLRRDALAYHSAEPCGKLQILPTKPMATQHDLALAYSPGVAIPCEEIAADPSTAALYTGRGNLVAVISNGTAVLGLGNIGALASKPVMEGKAALFKKFSGIDVVDLEVDETDIDAFCETVRRLEPSFGGINLEDIAAPACFEIETRLKREMNIPVFHDDQHGTAIVASAAVLNALDLVDKRMEEVRIVCNGAGAAALACLDLLVSFGARKENILLCDSKGVAHSGRGDLNKYKASYVRETDAVTLADAMKGADIFLGVSVARALKPEMVAAMADKPIILALANPEPEIRPEAVAQVRSDAIMATGRSDYPNQVNNVLCFPFIFRGALDCGAREINMAMKRACAEGIARIARQEASHQVRAAYGDQDMRFGPDYIIPKPFDSRLMVEISALVAQAAMETGVAERPIEDMDAYRERLQAFVFRSGMLMKPVFEKAQRDPKRVVYAEGDSERVLMAAHRIAKMGMAQPILVGDREDISERVRRLGLSVTLGDQIEVVDPKKIDLTAYADDLHKLVGRDGVSPKESLRGVRNDPSVLAFLMLHRGEADAAICGTGGRFGHHLVRLKGVIGLADGVDSLSTLSALVLPSGTIFIADAYATIEPTAEEVADLTQLAATTIRRMGVEPRAGLVSHANFGDRPSPSSKKMREAARILKSRHVDFEFDGEMHADTALRPDLREKALADSGLSGAANLFIMPNADAAHIALSMLRTLTGSVSVGPIMMGAAKPAYIASQSVTVRGIENLTAIAVVEAQSRAPAVQKVAAE